MRTLLRRLPFVLAALAAASSACTASSEGASDSTSAAMTKNVLATPPETTALDAFAGDFDGDGKYDVARWQPAAGNVWNVALSCGADLKPAFWGGDWGSDGPIHVGDLNGDHKSDVFMWRDSNKDWTVNLSNGSGFTPQIWHGAWGSDGPIFVGDLNGDGKSDVFMWRDWNKDWTVNLSSGSGFAMYAWKGAWGSDGPIHVGDLNGDGKTDVFMWRDADKSWTVNLSTGSGFAMQRWTGAWGSDGPIHVGDLNGDGKTDVFMWRDADKSWTVNLSTGSGFAMQRWTGAWGSDGPINVGDLNGDGKSDVFMWRGDIWTVNLSTGTGFAMQGWNGAWGTDGPIHVADVNGDRKDDVIMHRADDTWSVNVSNGNGFQSASWTSEPVRAPTINAITVTHAVSSGGEIDLKYDVTFPPGCAKPWGQWTPLGQKGWNFVGFTPDPSGKGSLGLSDGLPVPVTLRFMFNCQTTDACYSYGQGPYATMDVNVVPPPQPSITSFTTSPQDGSPQYGRQCYGLKQSFSWNVSFPNSQCTQRTVTLSATDDDRGGKVFFVANNLDASGSLDHVADANAHYTLTAKCIDDGQSVSKVIPVSIAPASQCGSSAPAQGDWYCFKAVGKIGKTCMTDAIWQDTEAHATSQFQSEFPTNQFDDTSIDCTDIQTACPSL